MKRATLHSFAHRVAALGAAIFALVAATDALALSSAWQRSDVTEVRLVSAQDAIDAAGKASIGLQFRLAPGWKIYWRSPGESGLAPQIDWSGSTNLDTATVSWPVPERFIEIGELVTHGYKDEVVLPIVVSATDPARPTALRAVVNYLACEQICVPFTAELTLELPPGPAGPTAFGGLIALAAAMGVGRFVYPPILPFMADELGLSAPAAGVIASANFLGYLLGALAAAAGALPGGRRAWFLAGLTLSALTTGAMGFAGSIGLLG